MTIALLLQALLQYGPSIIPLVQKLVADIEAGKGNQTVTSADLAELAKLAAQTSGDIYLRLGIEPPPKA
jgi:hypothetical protein